MSLDSHYFEDYITCSIDNDYYAEAVDLYNIYDLY